MKIFNFTYLWLVFMACLYVSCDSDINTQDRNCLALDTLQFSDDYKTVKIDARVVGNLVMDDPSDTVQTKYRVFETSAEMGDTLSKVTAPRITHVHNVASEQMKQLDIKVVAIVDLTMDQPLVNDAKLALQKMRCFFPAGSIYVSFMSDSTNMTAPVPLSEAMLEYDFASVSLEKTNKFLYRNILSRYKDCAVRRILPGRNKVLVVLSDGMVWGLDSPLDPDHFVVQQELLDYAQEQGERIPVFFAGMSSEESLSPETNTTMQLVCARTGGLCSQGFNMNEMHKALCRSYHLPDVDLRYELEYPDSRVFWGEPTNLCIQCIQGDSIVAYGERIYSAGSLFSPVVVNGMSQAAFVLLGFLNCMILILVCYVILQFIVPYVRYRIFRKKYVAPYTGSGMTIAGRMMASSCYFCKAPFELGEMIVGRCEHTMHEECWEENDYHCTEYGSRCPDGSHYYDKRNLFNPANAPYYMRWVLMALLAAVFAWCIFYIMPAGMKQELLFTFIEAILDKDEVSLTFKYTYRQPFFGLCMSAFFVGFISFLVRKRLPKIHQVRDLILRVLLAGIGGYTCFFFDVLTCTVFRLENTNDLIGALALALMTAWNIFIVSFHTSIRVNWKFVGIAFVVFVVGTFISTSYYWGVAYDFRVLQLISLMIYNVILALALAYDVKRSEHYFLHVEGAIKTMDIALYKWLRVSPSAVVTIGKSVACDLQLSWDIESDVAPHQAEIRFHNGHPCLFACEEGVLNNNGKPVNEDDYLRLYHGTKFRIGNTLFTYVEKDK